MSKRHNAIFDDVLKDLPAPATPDRGGARFLKRTNALSDSGEREEKVLRWVDPASCVMWVRHNRAYDLLTEENCRDLIDSLKSQGQQEFPAIVRRLPAGQGAEYEVICGARRHFAVSWLRANNYPQFRYLIEVRDLTDEEAFRLADIENRDRADLSDYERACDYLQALAAYYGGKQKTMAARLEVSEAWLSRYLHLARLPKVILAAWPRITEIRELHARQLRVLLHDGEDKVMAEAERIAAEQTKARAGQGPYVAVPKVLSRLKAAVYGTASRANDPVQGVTVEKRGNRVRIEFLDSIDQAELRAALDTYLSGRKRN